MANSLSRQVLLCFSEAIQELLYVLLHLLMFDLVVEVSGKPIIEESPLDVTRAVSLHSWPVVMLISINLHRNMVHLGNHDEPVTLEKPIACGTKLQSGVFDFGLELLIL